MKVGLIEFNTKGIITKGIGDLETNLSDTICTEKTTSKKSCFCVSLHRSPSSANIVLFFDKLTISFSKAVNKFHNQVVMDDFNIDITKEDFQGFGKVE